MMSAHIVELDTSVHGRVQKLLSWFAGGQLAGAELTLVEAHLPGCAECRAALEWEHKLRACAPALAALPDVDAAFARLLPRLEQQPRQALPGRRNIVIPRDPNWHAAGAERAGSLEEAIASCEDVAQAWVTGGAQIY